MSSQASIAKISAPRLFGVVARQRLFLRLDENRGRPLIWVEGPPGAGKTTLIASYLEARGIPTLWYQVDPGDVDPGNLFFVALAAEAFPAPDAPALPRLVPEHLADLPAFARTFFRQLFERLPAGAVIVLDNYQEVPAHAPLHDVLRTAIAEVPPGRSVCCVSRNAALPAFSQLAANGSEFALRWDTLRLSLDETREISAKRGVCDDWLVQALHRQSEGWAAGVTLMLERLGQTTADAAALPATTLESVFNYFASLLFDQAPEPTRQTLLSVAFLPHMTAEMATALSGRADAGDVLEQLYRRHLFTDRRPGAEPVYQFHALFRDFLRTRACEGMDSTAVRRSKVRTADVLEAHGNIEAAMDLRLAVGDWPEAVRTITQQAKTLLDSGRRQTLERWIEAFPSSVRGAQPQLLYWLAMSQVQTAPKRGIGTLRQALPLFRETGDAQGEIDCLAGLLNAAFLGFVALEAMDEWLDDLLACLQRIQEPFPVDVELRVWGVLCSALLWIRPWHPWTATAPNRVEALLARGGAPGVALAAASSAVAATLVSGEFDCGNRIALATLHLVDRPGASPSEAAWWLLQVGHLSFNQARYDEALHYLRRACQVADVNGMRTTFTTTLLHRVMVEFRVCGWAVANATLAEIESLPRPGYPQAEAQLYAYQARRAQFRGLREEAADLGERVHATMLETGSQFQELLFTLVGAELVLDAGRIEKARQMLLRCHELIDHAPVFDSYRAALGYIEARLAQVEGTPVVALTRLKESLLLAKMRNRKFYLRYFECAMPPLFALALSESIEVELVQQMIRMFRLKPPLGAPDSWPWPIRVRTLGRFEVLVDDKPLEFSRKVPRKTLSLLRALVAHGGREVSERVLCDALWADEEADAARQALGITIVRLRKLLGSSDAVSQQGGKVSLDRAACWVDAWRFEELAAHPEPAGEMSRALNLYGGEFLPEDQGEPWSVPARERLRGKFVHLLATHGRSLEDAGDSEGAIRLYLRGIDAAPIVEVFYQGLMRCYAHLGRHTEAISAFRRLRQTLSVVLGLPPSSRSEALHQAIVSVSAKNAPAVGESVTITPPGRRGRASNWTGSERKA